MQKAGVIGSGFAGLSAATCLAQAGYDVTIFEKNPTAGGRARKLDINGYRFDMGPSWYWMPDVFEHYFQRFGKKVSNYYDLVRLDPSYRTFFSATDKMDLPAGPDAVSKLFEQIEPGGAEALKKFLAEAKYKYEVGMQNLVYKPGLSITELFDLRLVQGLTRLTLLNSVAGHVRKHFKDPRLIKLLEFPVLFLGSDARHTPALYTLMNYADIELGTWYPQGGMYKIVEGMVKLAEELGVQFRFDTPITAIDVHQNRATALLTANGSYEFDVIVAGADYHHAEQLLQESYRNYTQAYWKERKMAPSCLIFYAGVKKKLKGLLHHNLFFDSDFSTHSDEIYKDPAWPTDPLFYVSVTSRTDPQVAPVGHENLFILIPLAAGLHPEPGKHDHYLDLVVNRIERATGELFRADIDFVKSYAHEDFVRDYHAYKGNAYGLANTLRQTANLKPSIANKKVSNLFYTGQLTVPGPGVPPSLVSGQVVADEIIRRNKLARKTKV